MKNKKIIILLLIIFILTIFGNLVYAINDYDDLETLNDGEVGSAENTIDIPSPSEEYLNKEIEFTSIIEVKQGTTVKEFIQQEKERRLKEFYKEKIDEGYKVEFGNALVYALNGTTNRDSLYNKIKLNDDDLIRTNVDVEIGVYLSKDGRVSGAGEGEHVGVVVLGDVTGTGEIDVTDLSTIQEELVESTHLKGTYRKAADMDKNEEIDVVDLSQLQQYIVNN